MDQNERSAKILTRPLLAVGVALAVLALAGCASNPDYQAQIAAYRDVETTRAKADAEKYAALAAIAQGADAGTKQTALQAWQAVAMVDSMKLGGRGTTDVPAAPPTWYDRGFNVLTSLAPVAAQVWGQYYGLRGQITMSNNATAASIANINAFRDMSVASSNSMAEVARSGFTNLAHVGGTPRYVVTAGNDATIAFGGSATRTTTTTVNCTSTSGSGGSSSSSSGNGQSTTSGSGAAGSGGAASNNCQ
ncbi:MAG: hypothetical protein ACK4XK_09770 [Casimicrobiaceae bacterium]